MESILRSVGSCLTAAARFARAEDGSATVWNLTWLAGFAIMGGVAVDSTNAWRHKTMLSSTADVAVLSAAWELPESYLEEPYVPGGYAAVENVAMTFAGKNLAPGKYGSYFQRDDIFVGNWNPQTRTFVWGGNFAAPDALPVDAVRVFLGQNDENKNKVQTTLLRFLGIYAWDINTTATAVYGVPKCYRNGFIGREGIDLASNAKILTDICLHGQLVSNVNNHIYWSNPKSLTTGLLPPGEWAMKGYGNQFDLDGKWVDMSKPQRQNMYPPMVDRIPSIGRAMLRGDKHYRHFLYPALSTENDDPPTVIALRADISEITGSVDPIAAAPAGTAQDFARYWLRDDAGFQVASLGGLASVMRLVGLGSTTGGGATEDGRTTTFYEVEQQGGQYLWPKDDPVLDPDVDGFSVTTAGAPPADGEPVTEHRIYFAETCKGGNGGTLKLSGIVRNVTIITNCQIDIAKDARIENAVLLSTAGSANHNAKSVEIANGAQIGARTACENWGGVRIYANGTITTPSSGNNDGTFRQWYGAHLVARTSVQFAGLSDSSKGISILAGGEIKIASNTEIGALDASNESTYPAGGCPEDGVVQAFGPDAYMPILVD